MTGCRLSLSIRSLIAMVLVVLGVASTGNAQTTKESGVNDSKTPNADGIQVATFGGGCFWCVEAVFEGMKGVKNVVSGYAGGTVPNPTYEQVCSKLTGHAEVCQIFYDPKEVSYVELLEVFFKTHDPTTLNRQGNDIGTQYRSVIFYHDDQQKELATKYKQKLDTEKVYRKDVVTEISPLPVFYMAEAYHQDYYRNNPNQGYCVAVVRNKVQKAKKVFKEMEEEAKSKPKK